MASNPFSENYHILRLVFEPYCPSYLDEQLCRAVACGSKYPAIKPGRLHARYLLAGALGFSYVVEARSACILCHCSVERIRRASK